MFKITGVTRNSFVVDDMHLVYFDRPLRKNTSLNDVENVISSFQGWLEGQLHSFFNWDMAKKKQIEEGKAIRF